MSEANPRIEEILNVVKSLQGNIDKVTTQVAEIKEAQTRRRKWVGLGFGPAIRDFILNNGDYVFIVGAACVVSGVWMHSESLGRVVLGGFLLIAGFALMKGTR